jgi:hypothetical protein
VLEKVEIETSGALDLRGFLGLDPAVPAGYETIRSVVRIKGSGPNYFNLARPVKLEARLVVEG